MLSCYPGLTSYVQTLTPAWSLERSRILLSDGAPAWNVHTYCSEIELSNGISSQACLKWISSAERPHILPRNRGLGVESLDSRVETYLLKQS